MNDEDNDESSNNSSNTYGCIAGMEGPPALDNRGVTMTTIMQQYNNTRMRCNSRIFATIAQSIAVENLTE